MKWYHRIGIKIYIYGKSFLALLYFFSIGMWFIKTDKETEKEYQKKEDEKLLKLYKEVKEMKITKL